MSSPVNVTRSQSVAPTPQATPDAATDFVEDLRTLTADDVRFATDQGSLGGQVSPTNPRLWSAYQGYVRSAKLRDTPELRSQFMKQVGALDKWMAKQGGLQALDVGQERLFRATHAYRELEQRKNKQLSADDAWIVRALSDPKVPLNNENLDLLKGFTVGGSRAANLAELVRPQPAPTSVRGGQQPRRPPADAFERQTAPLSRPKPRPRVPQEEVLTVNTVDNPATTPEGAVASRLANVSADGKTVAALQQRMDRPGAVIDERTPSQAREAYRDFLAVRQLPDTPATQREFVTLLGLRGAALSRSGKPTFSAADERAFLADAALARLRQRAQAGQSLSPREGEEWMLRALSNPSVPLTAADRELLSKVEWRNQSLRTTLLELRSKAEAQERESQRPPPGAPYSVQLNTVPIFDGDPQVNAFTQAARAGGYNDAEITRAMEHLQSQGVKLFCKLEPGEPLIMKPEDAELTVAGGQQFVTYNMSENASLALRDSRHSIEQGYDSVAAYRQALGNSWSSVVTGLGEQYLAFEQQKNRALGFEDNPILGPLVRGGYDAMRELILVGANGAQVAEMAVTTAQRSVETGNLFYSIAKDDERSRYFDANARKAEETFLRLGKTYPAEEQNLAASFARSVVGSTPKMAVSVVPGAAIYYNALKHLNHDPNEFMAETALDLLGSLGGPLAGRLSSGLLGGASRVIPGLVDNAVANRVVTSIVERGSSAVVGATSNVVQDMGPIAVQNALGTADPEEVKKRLTWEAFGRNVGTGVVMGLLLPDRHVNDDLVLLSKKGTSLAGPLYGVKKLNGEMDYYSAVKVEGTNGKGAHHEFVKVSPDDPKVRETLRKNEVTIAQQEDVNAALALSRYEYRLTPKGREDLKAQANKYAEQIMLTNAEKGVQTLEPNASTNKPTPAPTKTGDTSVVEKQSTPLPAPEQRKSAEVEKILSTERFGVPLYSRREKSLLRTLDSSAELEVRVNRGGRSRTERMTTAQALELAQSADVEGVEIRRVFTRPKVPAIDTLGDKASTEVRQSLANMDEADLGEAVLQFRSGKAARVYGNRDMLVQAASHPDVMRVELDSGSASWLPTVDQVDAASRTASYDALSATRFGEGVRYMSKGSELAGMRVHHGAVDAFEDSIRQGPKNIGSGFGGSGLYVAVDGDRRIAESFADKAASEAASRSKWYDLDPQNGVQRPPKARVLDGVINPEANLRVGKFRLQRNGEKPDLQRGILPDNWSSDPELRALLFREFDVLDLRGMKSGGLAMDTDRMLVFHESAGANAILWEP